MKKIILLAIIVAFFSVSALAQKDRGIGPARKAYDKIVACKGEYLKRMETIVGLLSDTEILATFGKTPRQIKDIADGCIERKYSTVESVANLKRGIKRSWSLANLAYTMDEMGIPVTNFESLSQADQRAVQQAYDDLQAMRKRLYFNSRMERFGTRRQ